MKLTRETTGNAQVNVINGYLQGIVHVNNVEYSKSLIVSPEKIISPWAPAGVAALEIKHFEPVIEFQPEVVILGTGVQHQFVDRSFMLHLLQHGAGFEAMDTPAACRTYNVLLGEGRRVVAALLLPG